MYMYVYALRRYTNFVNKNREIYMYVVIRSLIVERFEPTELELFRRES